jgi:butyrate kinase
MVSGGMKSYEGTNDLADVVERYADGDMFAGLVIRSMAYQAAQEISAQAVTLRGKVDAIILTGGCAKSPEFVEMIKERVSWITDSILVYPGDDELRALAVCAYRVLNGEEPLRYYSRVVGPGSG